MSRIADPGRKSVLYDAAQRLFSARGYHATSMRDIAAELDCRGASLYAHVGSKEDLLWAVVCRAADRFIAALEPIVAAPLPPAEKLARAIEVHVRVVTQYREAATVYQHEWQQLGPRRRAAVRRRRDAYEAMIRAIIAEGAASGDFAPVDPKLAGLLILSTVNGVYQWYRADGPFAPEEIAAQFTALILNGLGCRVQGTGCAE